jgi:hypothetical protein
MNKPSETKDTITEKPAPNVLSEQELEKASGGAFDTYRPAADSSSPILYSGIGGGKAGLPTKD